MCPECEKEPKGFLCIKCQTDLEIKHRDNEERDYLEQDNINDVDSFDDKGLDEY